MHLLVLSAFRLGAEHDDFRRVIGLNAPFGAQCFPTVEALAVVEAVECLNAPFGAQCFPTFYEVTSVLAVPASQCTFWCSVLSDQKRRDMDSIQSIESQCTFWCSVLSDLAGCRHRRPVPGVSMHLLVLSAFRLVRGRVMVAGTGCLNAPFGAQCFPTCRWQTRPAHGIGSQ